jgi:hypothetical protein
LRADVLVENFKPGTFDRMGLGFSELSQQNPRLVYCSITGFGPDNPDLPGYDLVVQAVGGLMSITGTSPDEPVKVGVALVDVITGLHAAVGILAALQERQKTGLGQRVEVNLLSSLLSGLVNQSAGYAGAGFVPGIMGNRHPSIAPYESYPTADRQLVIAVGNDRQFRACAEVLGAPEWADDERFATNRGRVTGYAELRPLVAPFFDVPWLSEAIEVVKTNVTRLTQFREALRFVTDYPTPVVDRLHLPFAAVAFSAVVSLMPGFFLFNAATGLVELVSIGPTAPAALLTSIVTSGATAFLVIMAMTFGLILPRMLFKRVLPSPA